MNLVTAELYVWFSLTWYSQLFLERVPFTCFFFGYQLAKSFENAHSTFFILSRFSGTILNTFWIPHSRCYHDWCNISFFVRIPIPNFPFRRQSAPAVNLWKWIFWIQSWLASNYPKLDIYSFESFLSSQYLETFGD